MFETSSFSSNWTCLPVLVCLLSQCEPVHHSSLWRLRKWAERRLMKVSFSFRSSLIPVCLQTHANNQSQIVEVTKSCQEIVAQLRKDCAAIAHDCPRAQSDVIHARKALHQAFLTHSATCRWSQTPFQASCSLTLKVKRLAEAISLA